LGRPAKAGPKQRCTRKSSSRELERAPVYLGPKPVSSVATSSKLLSRLAVVTVLLIVLAPGTSAHEVPNEVTVLGFVHPEGKTLRLLVRAPFKSMRDIDVPT